MTLVNVAGIRGEKGTGFEKRGNRGPFECGNCHYYERGKCHQKTMMAESRQPKSKDGYPEVGSEDCCEYVSRIAKVF
jgi:hypothetical protein